MTATSHGLEEEELMMQLETCILIISERASCGEMEREKEREGMLAMAKWSQLRRGTVTWSRVAALPVL